MYNIDEGYNLFLDDVRSPSSTFLYTKNKDYIDKTWIIVRNYDDFVKVVLEKGMPVLVSFDHDLADVHYNPRTWVEGFKYHEKTGKDCAVWLVNHCMDTGKEFPKWYVHSMNPVGGRSIVSYITSYLKMKNTDDNGSQHIDLKSWEVLADWVTPIESNDKLQSDLITIVKSIDKLCGCGGDCKCSK